MIQLCSLVFAGAPLCCVIAGLLAAVVSRDSCEGARAWERFCPSLLAGLYGQTFSELLQVQSQKMERFWFHMWAQPLCKSRLVLTYCGTAGTESLWEQLKVFLSRDASCKLLESSVLRTSSWFLGNRWLKDIMKETDPEPFLVHHTKGMAVFFSPLKFPISQCVVLLQYCGRSTFSHCGFFRSIPYIL